MAKEPAPGEVLYSLDQVCLETGGYPRLIRALVREYNVGHWKVSSRMVFNRAGLERLRTLVHGWKNRMRIRQSVTTSSS
jgi:hypothetical protein